MFVLKIKFFLSIQQLGSQRVKFQHKINFTNDKISLRLKTTPVIALTTRLFRDGKFLRIYKTCQKFFINFFLKNISNLPINNEFKNFFLQHQSFKNFDRVLFWKIMSINCLFNLKKLKTRKILYYLPSERRHVLVLLWLKFIIKNNKKNLKNNSPKLLEPVYRFITTPKQTNEVYLLKLKMYRWRLLRG